MDTLELILAELRKTPNISVVNTVINRQDAQFTIYHVLPCSTDIYCVFLNPETNTLYALQNTGSAFWGKLTYEGGEKYFLLPITSYLINDREACLTTFVKWCRQSELGEIPIRLEQFVNPFI